MKIINLVLILLFYTEFSLCENKVSVENFKKSLKKISKSKNKKEKVVEKTKNPFMTRFLFNMKEIATKRLKSDNLYQKRLQSGILPEGFPKSMSIEAKKFRENKNNWKQLMAIPTEVWRGCVYPHNKMNYINWCRSLYATKSELELKCNHK